MGPDNSKVVINQLTLKWLDSRVTLIATQQHLVEVGLGALPSVQLRECAFCQSQVDKQSLNNAANIQRTVD